MAQHWYDEQGELQPEGVGFPSVTTILDVRAKPQLEAWRLRVGADEAAAKQKEKSELGTRVHAAVEKLIQDGWFATQNMAVDRLLQGYVAWKSKVKPSNLQSELFLFHPLHEYAGRADLICEIDGELWVIDFKTGAIRPEHGLQLAGYAEAFFAKTGVRLRRAVLQLTDKIKRGYRFKEFTDENDFGVFMAHKEIFDWLREVAPEKSIKPAYEEVMV